MRFRRSARAGKSLKYPGFRMGSICRVAGKDLQGRKTGEGERGATSLARSLGVSGGLKGNRYQRN
jgi:hypothetical protein